MSKHTQFKKNYHHKVAAILLLGCSYLSPTLSQERVSRENYPRQQPQTSNITPEYVNKVLDELKAPPPPSKDANSAEVKSHLKILSDKNKLCKGIWLAGKPDVGILQWNQEQRQNFLETCNEAEVKLRDFEKWAKTHLPELEKNENKIAQEKFEENLRKFMSIQPDLVLLANSSHQQLSITKKLNNSYAIENKRKDALEVQFYSTSQNPEYSKRFLSLNTIVQDEIARRVKEILDTYNIGSEIKITKSTGILPDEKRIADKGNTRRFNISHPFLIIDKIQLDKVNSLLADGELIVVGNINSTDVTSSAKITQERIEKKAAEELNSQNDIFNKIKSAPNEISAILIPNPKNLRQVCITQKSNPNQMIPIRGYRVSRDFTSRTGLRQEDRFDHTNADLDETYKFIQTKKCDIFISENRDVLAITNALRDLKTDYKLLPSTNTNELTLGFITYKGFKDIDQYNFANQIGADSIIVNRLGGLGVLNLEQYKSAAKRMNDLKYSSGSSLGDVLIFLEDDAEGKSSRKSAIQIREARQVQIAKAAKEAESKLIKDLPKYTISAMCLAPAGGYVETLMRIASTAPGQFGNALLAQAQFCRIVNERVSDISIIKEARLVARGDNGAEYYVVGVQNGQAMIGIVKRP